MDTGLVDLRSDTVTQPSPRMRRAMAEAEVGDDVLGEDPTMNRLEAMAAERMGMEAGLFVTSGTQGNLLAILTHCNRGDEFITGTLAHTFLYEGGGAAALGGVHPYPLPNEWDGTIALDAIESAVRAEDLHFPPTRLITLENTHNRCGGTVLSLDYLGQVRQIADKHHLPVHMDGARVFNATVALAVDVAEITRFAHTVSFCLSKGLSAPVGSVLCGPCDFIRRARRWRKVVGGGMRQAGVLAAVGIVALEDMVERLEEDHLLARQLAEGLLHLPGLKINLQTVQTNIVYADVSAAKIGADELLARLKMRGVLVGRLGPTLIRAVTHYGITADDLERALEAFRWAVEEGEQREG